MSTCAFIENHNHYLYLADWMSLGQICNCNWLTNFILTHVGLFLCKRQLIKTIIVTKNQIPGLCMHNIHDRIRVIWLFLSFPVLFYHSYAVFVFCFFYFVVFLTWGKLYRTFLQIQFLWIVSAQKHKGVETKPKLSLVYLSRNS